ncbi:class I SAM-dependent methyltransferase [Apilactobacillus apisilvae]|uniref:Class I SAM-dependent methyltransferase n=1 Tax=Apilactobacillus apisilvae TaxID=2923364 RepID=A0ABY4PHE6_9LACO|nr:class I SAM-dependent methyltransferase [Apilactobacillus apisilvae]UQS84894.1 class I SAM-dependent methyltransferase [Apilactobacillus apisilvae]
MKKFTNWIKHWYRYKTDEPYIIALSLIAAFCLYGSTTLDHKRGLTIYVILLILIALWSIFRTVTFKKIYINKFINNQKFDEKSQGLDLGTGTGYALIQLAKDNNIEKAYGVEDIYQYSIQRLEKNAVLENVKDKIELKDSDITQIPYQDSQFNVATAIHGRDDQLSNHSKSIYLLITNELNRVVKSGGKIFMLNTPGMIKRYKKEFERQGDNVQWMHVRFEKFFNLRAIIVKMK